MTKLPFFLTSCCNCRRRLELDIRMLGREATCAACGESFVAVDPDCQSAAIDDPLKYWIRFTDHIYSKEEFEAAFDRDIARTPR